MLTKDALAVLEQVAQETPEKEIVWCTDCGRIRIPGHTLQEGSENCGRTLAVGTASQCIKTMMQ